MSERSVQRSLHGSALAPADQRVDQNAAMGDINVTPLVDVMLVLVIIFMITIPILTHPISIALPQRSAAAQPPESPTPPIELTLDAAGNLEVDRQPVAPDALEALLQLRVQVQQEDSKSQAQLPAVHIQAADATEYDVIAKVLAAVQTAGLRNISFVDEAPDTPENPTAP